MTRTIWILGAAATLCAFGCAPPPGGAAVDEGVGVVRRAVGEPQDGFPNWDERAIHLWINRGRADPQSDLNGECNVAQVADVACYTPQGPLLWSYPLNRAARFHSANQTSCGGMTHDSPCTLVADIGTQYTPGPCDGDKACSCQSGASSCSCTGACTSWDQRVGLFGGYPNGECIASGGLGDPLGEYYMWICEPFTGTACQYTQGTYGNTNGHRWNILMGGGPAVGSGCAGSYCTLDFGGPSASSNKIVVGVHYPASGSPVALRAHWHDAAGAPSQAMVNVNGTCHAMTKERGLTAANATYLLDNHAVGSGCARYYFVFKDAGGTPVTWPESGSYGINCGADYDAATRPAMDPTTCNCTPDCAGKQCGADGCGGQCAPGCGANATCSGSACSCTVLACGAACCAAGQVCYQDACCTKDCAGKQCGADGCGGSCGSCSGSLACDANGACGCQGGLTACGTACVNITSDVANCGRCDNPCPSPQVCAAGACSATCPVGLENCGGSCAELQADPTHCGDCATVCSPGATCAAGQCQCAGGLLDCPGAGCTDVATDPSNCGECGRECLGCADGRCPGDGDDGGAGDGGAGDGGAGDGALRGSCGCAGAGPGGPAGALLLALALLLVARRERGRRDRARGGRGRAGDHRAR